MDLSTSLVFLPFYKRKRRSGKEASLLHEQTYYLQIRIVALLAGTGIPLLISTSSPSYNGTFREN